MNRLAGTAQSFRHDSLAVLSLFASTSTLLCCALPTLLVTIGLGAAVAGAVSAVPWLVPLSRNKEWAFLIAGALIAANWVLIVRQQRRAALACEVPPAPSVAQPAARSQTDESACETASRFSRTVLWVSTGVYVVGFVVAFVAFPVGRALGLV